MLKSTNLITLLTNDIHSDLVSVNYKLVINTLTSMVGSSLKAHIFARRRGEVIEPTLDERNEQDEIKRSQPNVDQVNEDFGSNHTKLTPYRQAQIADGIRHALYEELHAFGEYDDSTALLRSKPTKLNIVNWNQPMSLEGYLDYLIEMSGSVDETKVKTNALRLGKTEEYVRELMRQDAADLKAMEIRMKPEVMTEAGSLTDFFDEDGFMLFDIETQVRFAEKLLTKFDNEYAKHAKRSMRGVGSLEAASFASMIEGQYTVVRNWLNDNDAEFRLALQLKAA